MCSVNSYQECLFLFPVFFSWTVAISNKVNLWAEGTQVPQSPCIVFWHLISLVAFAGLAQLQYICICASAGMCGMGHSTPVAATPTPVLIRQHHWPSTCCNFTLRVRSGCSFSCHSSVCVYAKSS